MKFVVVAALAILFFVLVRRKYLQVDLSFPWFLALIVLAFLSLNDSFVSWAAMRLGIVYEPIAIVFLTIFLLLGLSTLLGVAVSRIRLRQISLVRHLMRQDLELQEARIRSRFESTD